MPTRLVDLADREQDVEVCCSACGRRLGRYSTTNEYDMGVALHDVPHPEKADYKRPTGARHTDELGTYGRNLRYQWPRCGCGRTDIQRRFDRIGRLEVDEDVDPPRVYV